MRIFLPTLSALLSLVLLPLAGAGDEDATTRSTADRALPSAPRPVHEYVGIKKCRMCHTDRYESMLATSKAGAWEALKPGVNAEAKALAKLDPDADYTADGRCLACHAIGYNKPGGYEVPKAGDGRSQRLAEARQGVGCESCHGPGEGFIEIMREVRNEQRKYTQAELHAAGLQKPGDAMCSKCHNASAPCIVPGAERYGDHDPLNVDINNRAGYHEFFPMQFRTPPEKSTSASRTRSAAPADERATDG